MKAVLNGNCIKVSELEIPAQGKIPERAVVRDVRFSYVLDADGNLTDKIDAIRYDCVNPNNFDSFTIKVESTRPVVTKNDIESSSEVILINIPVNEVVIKPYRIDFGMAKVSIVAPFVQLVEN